MIYKKGNESGVKFGLYGILFQFLSLLPFFLLNFLFQSISPKVNEILSWAWGTLPLLSIYGMLISILKPKSKGFLIVVLGMGINLCWFFLGLVIWFISTFGVSV